MLAFAALAALAAPVQAAEFYQGKTVTMLINYPPGGPTDIEGRMIARHIAGHIPGKPTVIVKNMGGAAGNIGANYLGEVAGKDGLTLGFFTWNPVDQILGEPGLRVKYNDFVFVAGVQQPTITYARKDTPPGLAKGADIMKASNVKVGALGATSTQSLNSTLGLDILGVSYTLIHGYKGLKEVETAAMQGEVQLVNTSLPGYRASIEPNMVKPGMVVPLWHYDVEDANGNLAPSPVIPEVPTFLQIYQQVKGGAMPSGPAWEALRITNKIMNSMFRTAFLPPGSPPEAATEMRAAFAALWKDEAFLAEYEKAVKYRAGIIVGADGEKLIASLKQVKPELVAFLKDHTARFSK
jgi:tripartite-type tricarboxylate transporter receptor subunit TctC